jgi:Asp-tRNA(Asn)/Glu-tRNA(Gln) amidotransferase A subunit family amidase
LFSNSTSISKTNLNELGLLEAIGAIRNKTLSSEELTRALLDRIKANEERVQAFEWLDFARAVELSREADVKQKSGAPLGQLHGIGIGIKDIIKTKNIPTTMGSEIYRDFMPDSSAGVVRCIESAGAFVMGKTVTSEFAFFTPGKTRNPWNTAYTPGGSSSGSAAAVAMGFLTGAVGTQTNGSVIRPAAFCGVVGYKPTAGTIPLDGIHPFSPSLDQVGVFARSVPDVALLAAALQSKDPVLDKGIKEVIPYDLKPVSIPPRLAAVRSPVWNRAEEYAIEHFAYVVKRLREAGAEVLEEELPEPFGEAHAVHRVIMYAEGAKTFASLQKEKRSLISGRLNGLIDEGLLIEKARLEKALEQKEYLSAQMDDFMSGFDAVITLPATGEAPRDLTQTGDPVFCTIWSLCGVPALTIPAGEGPNGLPLGLQITGKRYSDENLLAVAEWCDTAIGWAKRIAG